MYAQTMRLVRSLAHNDLHVKHGKNEGNDAEPSHVKGGHQDANKGSGYGGKGMWNKGGGKGFNVSVGKQVPAT